MRMGLTAQERAFQDEVRTFLADNLTADLARAGQRMTSVYSTPEVALAWQAILHARGWAAPAWPVEHGGCGWSATQRWIFAAELARAHAPGLSPMGLGMCGPVLIGHGTGEQKAHFLPRILSGEDFWCQGYSEPAAGSDLASLQMSATDDGDHFVCTGHKLWTTHAHAANWIFCLVRTAREGRPQQGITFLLIDMTSPGVEVRPILMLSGEHIQNDVFFTDVRVPKANVVGAIGEGWSVAKYLLEFERGGGVRAPALLLRLAALADMIRAECPPGSGLAAEAEPLRAQLAALMIEAQALEAIELRLLSRLTGGEPPGLTASMLKILGSEIGQKTTELALAIAAHHAGAWQPHLTAAGGPTPDAPPPAGNWTVGPEHAWTLAPRYFNDRAGSIYAGSNEIQRGILARGLGL